MGDRNFWQNVWNDANGLPSGLPPVTPTSGDIRRPVDRLYEALGFNTNLDPFTLLQNNINRMKGQVEVFRAPMAEDLFDFWLDEATDPANECPC